MRRISLVSLLFVVLLSCSDDSSTSGLYGTWRLSERGSSPGSGYNVEPVPAVPAQFLILSGDGTVQSNIKFFDLDHTHYYELSEDPQDGSKIITFYPSRGSHNEDRDGRSFAIEQTSTTLRLYFRYCIEGCHLGFVTNDVDPH